MAKKQLTPNQQIIENDISRYKTNSKASNFALLSLVFGCLYFLCVYGQQAGSGELSNITAKFDNDSYVYTIQFGVSVILNLVMLLTIFLASQELKNYNKTFSYVVWIFAIIQIVRIFVYPVQTFSKELSTGGKLFPTYSFVFMVVWLVLSAACLIVSGYYGLTGALKREKYLKQVENGEIDLEAALKEEDAPAEEANKEVSVNA